MTFTSIQQLIPKAARKHGIYGVMTAIQVCKKAEEAINDIFKEREHGRVKPKTFSKGVLKIQVPSSAWAQEITLYRQKIIDSVNGKTGKKSVKEIKLQNC